MFYIKKTYMWILVPNLFNNTVDFSIYHRYRNRLNWESIAGIWQYFHSFQTWIYCIIFVSFKTGNNNQFLILVHFVLITSMKWGTNIHTSAFMEFSFVFPSFLISISMRSWNKFARNVFKCNILFLKIYFDIMKCRFLEICTNFFILF